MEEPWDIYVLLGVFCALVVATWSMHLQQKTREKIREEVVDDTNDTVDY